MENDITYVILLGNNEDVVGHIRSDGPPDFDAMLDHLASVAKFNDRYDFIQAYRGVRLGFAPLH